MNAFVANVVMCAEPSPKAERGERRQIGCCQPGTEIVTYGDVDLEFCLRHAVERYHEQAKG